MHTYILLLLLLIIIIINIMVILIILILHVHSVAHGRSSEISSQVVIGAPINNRIYKLLAILVHSVKQHISILS